MAAIYSKWLILPIFLILATTVIRSQSIGHTTITYTDATRNNRQIKTEIYYPSASAGDNTPIAPGKFPVIVFGHGFVMTWTAYQNMWTSLVPEGYIMAFPTTEDGFLPSHANFGQDLRFLVDEIMQTGVGSIVPVSSISHQSAIMGHSMGGGSAFLAAASNTSISTLVSFAAANTNPSSFAAAQRVTVPTLIFSGTNDCIVPPNQQQDLMYDSTAAVQKTQLYIKGGGHCFFANANFNCSFGESTCAPTPSISRSEQQNTTADFLKLWLTYYLKDDCDKAKEFQDSLTNSIRISHRQSQNIDCQSSSLPKVAPEAEVTIFPNPSTGEFTLTCLKPVKSLVVSDHLGKIIFTDDKPKMTTVINLKQFPEGIYFVTIIGQNALTYKEKLIKVD